LLYKIKAMRQDDDKRFWVQLGQYTSLAMLLPACIVVGYAIGYLLDEAFHTGYFKVIFLLLGVAAGMVELIKQLMKDTRDGNR
jgi:F0F1-type ATP synthase assembly protein I